MTAYPDPDPWADARHQLTLRAAALERAEAKVLRDYHETHARLEGEHAELQARIDRATAGLRSRWGQTWWEGFAWGVGAAWLAGLVWVALK